MNIANELFFFDSASNVWRYTSSQDDITYKNATWVSQKIDHDQSIEQSNNPLKTTTGFKVAAGEVLANLILNLPPNQSMKIKIHRFEQGKYVVVFSGRVVGGTYNDGWITVELVPIYTDLQATGLNEGMTRQCRYALGSRKCGAQITRTKVIAKAINGRKIQFVEKLPMQFQYGVLDDGERQYFIDGQPSESEIVLLHAHSIKSGQSVDLIKGCDGTMNTCQKVFNNALNFGGAEHIPVKNPYVGDPINR
ncbi:phage BR0599 family protein [Vibrio echinoideorum]|uniref:phage BR0599 family protein n=1 Tax=Vibrio echinoideorum TaxID=2100116 RepID=UPI00108052BF|nr:phage BR0599 family protein [Vibrio echinoideorum]